MMAACCCSPAARIRLWSSGRNVADGMTAITIILAMSFGLTVPK